MLCQDCKKRAATIHVTKIVNNNKKEKHLCETCAKKNEEVNLSLEPTFSIQHLLTGLLGTGGSTMLPQQAYRKGDLQCSNCNLTYTQFSQIGKMGCSDCYGAFGDSMEPVLKRIHGSSLHGGKIPCRKGGAIRLRKKIEGLKKDLKEKIDLEEFEEAARIRDEIKNINKKIEEGGQSIEESKG